MKNHFKPREIEPNYCGDCIEKYHTLKEYPCNECSAIQGDGQTDK